MTRGGGVKKKRKIPSSLPGLAPVTDCNNATAAAACAWPFYKPVGMMLLSLLTGRSRPKGSYHRSAPPGKEGGSSRGEQPASENARRRRAGGRGGGEEAQEHGDGEDGRRRGEPPARRQVLRLEGHAVHHRCVLLLRACVRAVMAAVTDR